MTAPTDDITAKHNRATIGILKVYAKLSAMTLSALENPPEKGMLTARFRHNRKFVVYLIAGHRTWVYRGRKLWTIKK